MTDSVITEHRPDILECLVNLSNDEVFTPPKIASEVLDLLPAEIWQDKNAKFLDPCCKSAIFLREIAMRLNEGLKEQIPNAEKRKNHILKNQLYGIAITEFTSWVSRRTLYCSRAANGSKSIANHLFNDEKGNIMYDITEHNWDNRGKCIDCGASQDQFGDKEQEGHAYQFIHTGIPKRFEDMEFDVIIGNPPYHMNTNSDSQQATPLYHKFIDQAKKLNPKYISMIIPSRWFTGGMGLNSFRENMLNDARISHLVDYLNPKECFPNNDIKGGICYFLWNTEYNGKCEVTTIKNFKKEAKVKRSLNEHGAVFIRDAKALSILEKVKECKEKPFQEHVSAMRPFGMPTNFRGQEDYFKDSIKVYQFRSIGYVKLNSIEKNKEWVSKHKIIVPKAGSNAREIPDAVLGKPIYAGPNTACTETYIVTGIYKNKTEAENAVSYIKTKFFRFLVSQKKITQDCTKRIYEFVPMQDFSKAWTDEKLYKKYKLTEEEINHIENSIKVME